MTLWERARAPLALLCALCLAILVSACGGGQSSGGGEEVGESAGVKYAPSGDEGTLAGTISFAGAAPEPKAISMSADPVCAQTNPDAASEEVVVRGGKLQNVFVYVKDGKTADGKELASLAFDAPPQPRVLDQKGCRYVPHVLGIQAGQKLSVTNSDPTSHNVNVQSKINPAFNQSQNAGQGPLEKVFAKPEVLVPVKCNQHPWMRSYVGVMRHPFYAVSGEDGRFEIKNLPPGTYTVVAWHEKFPEQAASVSVAPKEDKSQDFTFSGATALKEVQGGSLRLMPALELPAAPAGHH